VRGYNCAASGCRVVYCATGASPVRAPPVLTTVRIIVSRTDRIGDVVLTLPLCALLRSQLGADVVALGRAYTQPLLEASPHVDEVLDWDTVSDADPAAQRDFLRAARADAILHVFPRPDIARAALAARIPLRIGTSHRWFHWLTCNALEHFSRKRSALHEAQLNVRLAQRLLGPAIPPLAKLAPLTAIAPRVPPPQSVATTLRDDRFRLGVTAYARGRQGGLVRVRPAEGVAPRRLPTVLGCGCVVGCSRSSPRP